MKYYHGTIYRFKDLDLRFVTRYMDFGRGIFRRVRGDDI